MSTSDIARLPVGSGGAARRRAWCRPRWCLRRRSEQGTDYELSEGHDM